MSFNEPNKNKTRWQYVKKVQERNLLPLKEDRPKLLVGNTVEVVSCSARVVN